LKRALVHDEYGIRQVRIVGRGVTGCDAGVAHRFREGSTALDRVCGIAGEGLAPQPLHDGTVCITSVHVERVAASWRGQHVDDVV